MPFIQNTTIINFNTFSSNFFWTKTSLITEIVENCQMFSQILYTHYFVFFLMVGLILLIALLGSMMLTVSIDNSEISDN
jgi:NADH:ubiquinone oxidoreductase subunit 6 (subunit J)